MAKCVLPLCKALHNDKTHITTGLGRQACRKGYEVRFYRVADLVDQLEEAWNESKLQWFRNKFKKVDLIILDEMGYIPFSKDGVELLFQLVTDWYEQKSLIITSNLEFSQWNRIFVDARLTAALVDRVIHHAHIQIFTIDSYRVAHALSNYPSCCQSSQIFSCKIPQLSTSFRDPSNLDMREDIYLLVF
ncbi:hypothetical protein FPQ10_09480 [Allobacillus sp. SKP2-8]|nr:hypothetical protein FPQ10_09480 [Allobacillus sp. SKP2-8]